MPVYGSHNSITDVSGLKAGHYTDKRAASGVTVVLCEQGAVAGVDVRGSAPGTRETDLLAPVNLVEQVQGVVLSGGSVYGLAAADGVVRWLSERGSGFALDDRHVAPIVPAAVLFDLGRGIDFVPPVCAEWGRRACEAAGEGPLALGSVGAGTGAVCGAIKGGVGAASQVTDSGITVAAVVAVNSLGSAVDPESGMIWEGRLEIGEEFGLQGKRSVKMPPFALPGPAKNTTIGVVATDAALTKAQAQKVAQMAHDGLARSIRPSHTLFDGDTFFCMATGKLPLEKTAGVFAGVPWAASLNDIGHAAANCVSRAIVHGVMAAESLKRYTAFRDLEQL